MYAVHEPDRLLATASNGAEIVAYVVVSFMGSLLKHA